MCYLGLEIFLHLKNTHQDQCQLHLYIEKSRRHIHLLLQQSQKANYSSISHPRKMDDRIRFWIRTNVLMSIVKKQKAQ